MSKIKYIPDRGVSSQTKLSMLCFYFFGNVLNKRSKIQTEEYMFSCSSVNSNKDIAHVGQ